MNENSPPGRWKKVQGKAKDRTASSGEAPHGTRETENCESLSDLLREQEGISQEDTDKVLNAMKNPPPQM